MDLRKEIFSRPEKLWILGVSLDSLKKPLSPLIDMIDWYNNQLLAKHLCSGQIKVNMADKTLLATSGQLQVERIIIVGLGEEKDLESQSKTFLNHIVSLLEGLNVKDPWLVLPPTLPKTFIQDVQTGFAKHQLLSQGCVTVG